MKRVPLLTRSAVMIGVIAVAGACRDLPLDPPSADSNGPVSSQVERPTAASVTVFGPRTFVRGRGAPVRESVGFAVANRDTYETQAVLVVENGRADGSRRVASARVFLDEVQVVNPRAFARQPREIRVPITLPASGVLAVELASAPGAELRIRIEATQFLFSISGSVTGTEGVTVHVVGPDSKVVTTDAGGAFRADGLRPGAYTVSPSLPGAVFDPVELAVTLTRGNVTSLTFTRQTPAEGITPTDMARIDAEPETWIPAEEVVLPNGQSLSTYLANRGLVPRSAQADLQSSSALVLAVSATSVTGPQQRKNDIIALMVAAAQDYACGRGKPPCTKWNFPADTSDPVNKPSQTGLTYIWGGKNPAVRTRPLDGCPQRTYGVDCSGLISRVAERGGLVAPEGSANQSNPKAWSLPAAWQLEWRKVPNSTIETGDLVAWPGHIGIAQASGATATVAVISSTGSAGTCERNILPPRGPRSLTVQQLRLGAPTVLRLITTLSGTFDFHIRCESQRTDAGVIRFSIDNDGGGPFQATGNGVDYDGTPFTANLSGTYDPVSNIVDARMTIPTFRREDAFTLKLLQDDTGYFTLVKVVDNGGCVAAGRLVRVQNPAGSSPAMATQATTGAAAGPRLGGPSQ